MPKYRIVEITSQNTGVKYYKIQEKEWFWPFWEDENYFSTYSTLEEAKEVLDELTEKFTTRVITL